MLPLKLVLLVDLDHTGLLVNLVRKFKEKSVIKGEREESREGAVALMTDDDIYLIENE